MLTLSNDVGYIIMGRDSKIIPLKKEARAIWDGIPVNIREQYDHYYVDLLEQGGAAQIREKMNNYIDILSGIFSGTSFETVYHSSVWERIYPAMPDIDIYTAIVNSFLRRALAKINREKSIMNANGKPIRFFMLNVQGLFHLTQNKEKMFAKEGKNKIHRTALNTRLMFWTLLQLIKADLISRGEICA